MHEAFEYWAKRYGVSIEDLQRAVDKVGNSTAAVRKHWQCGGGKLGMPASYAGTRAVERSAVEWHSGTGNAKRNSAILRAFP